MPARRKGPKPPKQPRRPRQPFEARRKPDPKGPTAADLVPPLLPEQPGPPTVDAGLPGPNVSDNP
jgi:hypothetical protein